MVWPGWVRPSSGPMMWTTPWRPVSKLKKFHAEFLGVLLDGLHHELGLSVGKRPGLALGGHDMVHGGEGALWVKHLEPALAQHVKGLGAGDLVDEVQPMKSWVWPVGRV